MKRILLVYVLLLSFSLVNAQNLHLTFFGGVSNYQGDLLPKRFTFQNSNTALGVGFLYEMTDRLNFRANVTVGKIYGNDKEFPELASRNLSFSSPVTDIHLGLEYDLLNPYENSLTPYIFTGLSIFKFNPSTIDTTGRKVFLQPLGTEGQGFFMGRTKYSLTQASLPFGGGVKLALSENIRLRFEIGFRKTFTDYLDDVSTTYADQSMLLAKNGQRAVELAFRSDELKGTATSYPPVSSMRGNSGNKDWYYFSGLGLSFRLSPIFDYGGYNPGRNNSNSTKCPKNVF